jgi:hypothetical protein
MTAVTDSHTADQEELNPSVTQIAKDSRDVEVSQGAAAGRPPPPGT